MGVVWGPAAPRAAAEAATPAAPAPAAGAALAAALRPAARALSAALLAAAALASPGPALADGSAEAPLYFGSGCFWGRQREFVEAEKALGRTSPDQISALVGYAGGAQAGPDGRVCYYYSDPRTIYEKLGHAEVVSVSLTPGDEAAQAAEFRRFADTYFSQFQRLRNGKMQRLDPQDFGAGYRNVVGLPGGVGSPFFKWHQFHQGMGFEAFPPSYTRDLKAAVAATGKIDPTGCPELPF
ncbi:peptide methionine sulphoxide reductase [Raphidocelis subcapitata]|uniref:Peptide methionine sulphoxide reductase n=1 Tax=Raphidocelis subcapitata TaxID=307507 RepID=A0A2V0P5W0_9CHLO|nr:peptide methionine sulphoxide reductase [Raphidocelis subcapitata]|eukprot:GBF95248.1 peptide methionine sulphoxide reductase [Raphidocelis subcapitata]